MCGRYALTHDLPALVTAFGIEPRAAIPPRYNIAPGQPVLIVRHSTGGAPGHAPARAKIFESRAELAAVEWGFVAEWVKERQPGKPLVNARVETATCKPSFRAAVKRQRCLVPFSAWYEWKSEAGRRQPYMIEPVTATVGAFAGIWSLWHGPAGEHWLETMAILTGPASGPLKALHSRRPLIVRPEDYAKWTAPTDPLPRNFLQNMQWESETCYHWRRLGTRVNDVRHDDAACQLPSSQPAQKSLF